MNGKDKEALAILEKIHGIDPSDEIVIINIAFLNKKFGNKKEAKKYYKKLLGSKNEELKSAAEEALKDL